ncbi:hypothetical protein CR155_00125 [Pollutimonas nitritireducens]|uniref:Uncharacterized protein n=1 Tax=Pollutimonas nitritireducens TaxID=2045209 RepID=A0A2N4UKE6_9BURK|nr:hypothetical protein CR155_00125 [Pollutimonas nitritireducens]
MPARFRFLDSVSQGGAIGRMALVLDDLTKGRLVPLFAKAVRSTASYYFISTSQAMDNISTIETWPG